MVDKEGGVSRKVEGKLSREGKAYLIRFPRYSSKRKSLKPLLKQGSSRRWVCGITGRKKRLNVSRSHLVLENGIIEELIELVEVSHFAFEGKL